MATREQVINIAQDMTHEGALKIYNGQKKLPRGYKVTQKDPWCATWVSAVLIKAGVKINYECSCNELIKLNKDLWVEDDNFHPKIGDLVLYDWQDTGVGDNKGSADHVGIVCEINSTGFKVIEGNMSNKVGYRTLKYNGKFIRGFITPRYEEKKYSKGDTGDDVKIIQAYLKGLGLYKDKVDGSFGPNTLAAVKKWNKNNFVSETEFNKIVTG